METNRIQQFLAVAELGNLRKAAEILHISHSGLSKSLKALEDELGGAPLFLREGRGIVLTDHGRALAARGPSLLAAVDSFLYGAEKNAGPAALRIATFEVFSTYFLGALCADILAGEPLEVRELIPGQMEAAIAADQADIGITYEPVPVSGIEFLRVTRSSMGIFGLPRVFAQAELAVLPFAAPAIPLVGTPTGVKGLDGWPEDKVARQVRYRVDMMESALELSRRGLAVVFLPQFIARLHNAQYPTRLHLHELPASRRVRVQRQIYLVKRTATAESRPLRLIAQALRRYARDPQL